MEETFIEGHYVVRARVLAYGISEVFYRVANLEFNPADLQSAIDACQHMTDNYPRFYATYVVVDTTSNSVVYPTDAK